MSVIKTKEIIMPTVPDVVKKIKDAMSEASASYCRIEGEQNFLKELFVDLSESTDLPISYLKKISKIYHKQNIAEITTDQENITELYENLFGATE